MRYHSARGEVESAIDYARRWLALDRLHEPAHYHLIQLYALAGQHSAALRQYKACVQILKEELDQPPQQATIQLYESVKANRITGLAPSSDLTPPIEKRKEAPSLRPEVSPVIIADENRIVTVLLVDMSEAVNILTPEDGAALGNRFFKVTE